MEAYKKSQILNVSAGMRATTLVLGLALLVFMGSSAEAAVTSYTVRSDWETDVGGVFSEEFFADTTLNPGLSVVTSAGSVGSGMWNDRLDPGPPDTTTWFFATPIIGFGGNWDLAGPGGPGMGIHLFLDGVSVGDEIPNSFAGEFFGLISTTLFDEVLLTVGAQTGGAETYTLDNMVYAVPEPVTLSLLGLGGLVLFCKKRRAQV